MNSSVISNWIETCMTLSGAAKTESVTDWTEQWTSALRDSKFYFAKILFSIQFQPKFWSLSRGHHVSHFETTEFVCLYSIRRQKHKCYFQKMDLNGFSKHRNSGAFFKLKLFSCLNKGRWPPKRMVCVMKHITNFTSRKWKMTVQNNDRKGNTLLYPRALSPLDNRYEN